MTLNIQSRTGPEQEGSSSVDTLRPPEGLTPLEQALWTLTMFSKQVAAFTEDAALGLHAAAMHQLEQPAIPKLTRRERSPRRRPGGYRRAG